MNIHKKFMQRCLELSEKGLGYTAPNPIVGCVIVYDNKIIGEGYHQIFGGPHAEVNAINDVQDKNLLKNSTLYVTLEPCSHYGKTPPCTELIIKMGIPKVVISCTDNSPKVSGKGIKMLKAAGIEVEMGILKKEYEWINRRFFTFNKKNRPYVILKWAETKDGFIDIYRTEDIPKITWITNEACRTLVHKWRTEEQALLIGTKTANNDNPLLTARSWVGKNPIRIVFDKNLSLSTNLNIFNNESKILVITESKKQRVSNNLDYLTIKFDENLLQNVLHELYNQNIQSLIVEGGSHTLSSFIIDGLWDEARVFTGEIKFEKGLLAPEIKGQVHSRQNIGNSKLEVIMNKKPKI